MNSVIRQLVLWALCFAVGLGPDLARAQSPNNVTVQSDEQGHMLLVDDEPVFVFGMNWGYMPIGENYSYNFWDHPDDWIEAALTPEMQLLQRMGVNAIRQYPGIPERWVTWIYENYGIYTMINPLTGRYGLTVDGRWVPVTDYSDPTTREVIRQETLAVVERYKDTPGMLFWLLGNENNYGLEWSSFEIEALPKGDRQRAKAVHLYSLWGELIDEIHAIDPHHPVSIANGDLGYADLIVEHCPNLDIMGSNVYRGPSSRDLFQRVADEMGIPLVYTEFGSDAFNARTGKEDHLAQARILLDLWQEIYEQSYGKGGAGTAIGGFIFQWSDGWWKYQQETNLDIHDTNASWPNEAYQFDFVEGENNMNEEWFGITAKGPTKPNGMFDVYPRSAYFALGEAFELDPYDAGTTVARIRAHYGAIDPTDYATDYATALLSAKVERISRASISEARVELSMFTTDGSDRDFSFDHMESFYVGLEAHPVDALRADLSVNILGNVAQNRIDEIFYESRGRDLTFEDIGGEEISLARLERLRVYSAGFEWEHKWFALEGFFRKGHLHWGYEGDFWGLMPDTFYGDNIDIYNADVPNGLMFTGKRGLDGLKIVAGTQVYWGANPTVIGKYQFHAGRWAFTVMHQEDVAEQFSVQSSVAIPEPLNRKTALVAELDRGNLGLQVGALMAGSTKIGWDYRKAVETTDDKSFADSGYHILEDEIYVQDTLGGKAKLTLQKGPANWYVQGGYQGLVADAGGDWTTTYTGWRLKPDGRGNQVHVASGLALLLGPWTLAPNALYNRPLEGPMPAISDTYDFETGWYTQAVTPRNFRDDPFAVLGNRETLGLELLIAYDPTPGSWMWQWNNVVREDAVVSWNLDFVYRMQPTSRDATFGFTGDGFLFAFPSAPPAQDVWEANGRLIWSPRGDLRLIFDAYAGTGQANGSDERLITRGGGGLTVWYRTLAWNNQVKIGDWGPYDFHRDFNLTFPLQVMTDLSIGVSRPNPFGPYTQFGILGKVRTFDEFSPAEVEPVPADRDGYEYEIGTYAKIKL